LGMNHALGAGVYHRDVDSLLRTAVGFEPGDKRWS